MKKIYNWFFAVLMMVLAGCKTLGVEAPESAADRYAYAVLGNAAVRTAAADAFRSGKINRETGTAVLAGTSIVRTALDLSVGEIDVATAKAQVNGAFGMVPVGSEWAVVLGESIDLVAAKSSGERITEALDLLHKLWVSLNDKGVKVLDSDGKEVVL